jgi:hypothetical protein
MANHSPGPGSPGLVRAGPTVSSWPTGCRTTKEAEQRRCLSPPTFFHRRTTRGKVEGQHYNQLHLAHGCRACSLKFRAICGKVQGQDVVYTATNNNLQSGLERACLLKISAEGACAHYSQLPCIRLYFRSTDVCGILFSLTIPN